MFTSIIDNDLYKFTMQNAVCKLYPRAHTLYNFTDRNGLEYPLNFATELRQRVDAMAALSLKADEYKFLADRCYYLDPVYLDFLKNYRFDPNEVIISQPEGKLDVKINGPWYRTILWEVPLLAMISQLYFEMTGSVPENTAEVIAKTKTKADSLASMGTPFSDFGTRRRYSLANHQLVVKTLKENSRDFMMGTSNVFLAMLNDLTPVGTMAHEWIMFHAATYGYLSANRMAFERWVNVYQGEVGIALSDTYTTETFLRDFTTKEAKLFDGVRQDSGDPIEFARKMIDHYQSLHIDPRIKTIVFSDSLNLDTVSQIREFCDGKIRDTYGIGTYFTNDVGVTPLNIVIKMLTCARDAQSPRVNTVKLSDDKGKHMGDPQTVKICQDRIRSA